MEVVLFTIVFFRLVALQTNAVTGGPQSQAVRFMAVTAGDTGVIHPALQKGPVDIHFVVDLAISEIHTVIEQAWQVMVHEGFAVHIVPAYRTAPGVAARAHPDLFITGTCLTADSVAGFCIHRPDHIPAFIQRDGQPFAAGVFFPAGFALGPGNVLGAGPVAGLAGHIDLRPGGREGLRGGIVVLLQIRGMAFRAHAVPVLAGFGPVQLIVVCDLLVGVQVKPALTSLHFRPCIPGQAQRLQTATGKFHQVLLQRFDTESVLDRVVMQRAVRAFGANHERPVLPEKG